MVRKDLKTLQPYPREESGIAAHSLFPRLAPPIEDRFLLEAIDAAFTRCVKDKKGEIKSLPDTPEKLVKECVRHLKERSDPIISSWFISQLRPEEIFELDAISHEMQRHRMNMGVFYQFLILELIRKNSRGFNAFDGSREGDIVADIGTPDFPKGLRLYISIKKSIDTVGGQDVSGVIHRLENVAKAEKNLTRPYLCVVGVATPPKGRIQKYELDRKVRYDREGSPLSFNCEYWGPGFIFPYLTGREAIEIYSMAIKRVADYLPFMALKFRKECSSLLQKELEKLGLIGNNGFIDEYAFLKFVVGDKKYDKSTQR